MLSIFIYIFAFLGILLIDEMFKIAEIHYLLLGVAASILLYGLSINIDTEISSLFLLYFSVIILIISVLWTALVYVFKIELLK